MCDGVCEGVCICGGNYVMVCVMVCVKVCVCVFQKVI